MRFRHSLVGDPARGCPHRLDGRWALRDGPYLQERYLLFVAPAPVAGVLGLGGGNRMLGQLQAGEVCIVGVPEKSGMEPERWKRLKELFNAARDLDTAQRTEFLARSCEGDSELLRTLESLLQHSLETGSTFDRAVIEVVGLQEPTAIDPDRMGRDFGRYRVIDKLGEGAMGEVFRALDTQLRRDVAIKVLPEVFVANPERLARFEREARVLASLNHPNIATIHGFEKKGELCYLVLELVEGRTLRAKLESGRLPLREAVRIAAQIAEGLARAHEAGVVHRDLKPDNLMLSEDGIVKILDFGLAKEAVTGSEGASMMPTELSLKTEPGRVMGTTNYMSPEQARGDEVDHRSDQFALGSVLYEMTTGSRAFAGETAADTLVAILRQEPEPPPDFDTRVPPPLRWIVERCLEKDPENRYASTRDLARDLRKLSDRFSQIGGARPNEPMPPAARLKRSRRLGAALLIAALVAAGLFWWRSKLGTENEIVMPTGSAESENGQRIPVESASIAVLPLDNLGPEEQEYFADGMTDALITHLSKIGALKVISRVSVQRYKRSDKSLPEIARELGVERILTGSVLHGGDRIRISIQLTEGATDENLWAESYEQDLRDILALQSQVAQAIASAIDVVMEPDEEVRIVTSRRVDPAAHEAYLQGLAAVETVALGAPSQEALLRASFGHFRRAIEIEPDWAEPHARLAVAYYWLASRGGVEAQQEFYPKSKVSAQRALELDDTVAQAHAALGWVLLNHEWNWDAAAAAYQRSLELDPNSSASPYAFYLKAAGRYDEAIEQYVRARERAPTNLYHQFWVGVTHLCANRPGEAEIVARGLIEAAPAFGGGPFLLGRALLFSSRYSEAISPLETAGEQEGDADRDILTLGGGPSRLRMLAYAKAKTGRVEEARAMLRNLEDQGVDWMPELYLALGDEDKAMAQIETAFTARRDVLLSIRCSVAYDRLLEIPRFREIVRAIGFPN